MSEALSQTSVNIVVYNERLAIVLGFITLAFTLATFFSCRSFLTWSGRLGLKNASSNRVFGSFFRLHSFYWWGWIFSLALHFLVGIMHIFNDPLDPDAYLHVYVLWAGVGAVIMTLVILTSCRSFNALLAILSGKDPLSGKIFMALYRFHAFYWVVLAAVVAAHFTFAYLHSGVWATGR